MQLTSILIILSATAASVSAHPAADSGIRTRQAAENNSTTGPKSATFACDKFDQIVGGQIEEMSKLKAQNIPIPPYLSGYYTAVNSGRQEIGCPGSITLDKRDFTPLVQPCDVINDHHERMMVLVNRFEAENIGVAPFIAGFLSASLDGHEVLECPPLTGPATEAAAKAKASGASSSTDSDSTDSGSNSS